MITKGLPGFVQEFRCIGSIKDAATIFFNGIQGSPESAGMIGWDGINALFTDLYGCQRFDGMDCQIQLLLRLFVEQAKATQIPPKGLVCPCQCLWGCVKM